MGCFHRASASFQWLTVLSRFQDYSARWHKNPPIDEPPFGFSNSEATLAEKKGPTSVDVKGLDIEKEADSDSASYLADMEHGKYPTPGIR